MIREVQDKSGAILFKKDKESQSLADAIKKIAELEERIEKLEKSQKSSSK